MKSSISREQIYLAALLHDVGKIGQRAKIKGIDNSRKSTLCPFNNKGGYYSHLHVLWTDLFFNHLNEFFRKFNWKNISNLASKHHKPDDFYTALIMHADRLASGVDRNYGDDEQNSDFRTVSLLSVLSEINKGYCRTEKDKNEICKDDSLNAFEVNKVYFDLVPLSSKNFYPSSKNKNSASVEKYGDLWNDLLKDFEKLGFCDYENFENFDFTLIHLLRRYMWAVPADTQSFADISLFEHSKLTAAISVALFDFYQKNSEAFQQSGDWFHIKDGYFPFSFVGVDISGIQDFIYNIISNKAAKSLKGRSFYLELLTLALIEKFKKIFNAFYGQIIYSAGGKFYALVANVDIKEKMDLFQKQVELELWQEHRDKLAVAVEAIDFTFDNANKKCIFLEDGQRKEVAQLWGLLNVALSEKKNKKYSFVIQQQFEKVFSPKIIKDKPVVCAVTGIDLDEDEKIEIEKKSDVFVAKIVRKQIELGTALKTANWLIFANYKLNLNNDFAKASIKILDTYFYLTDEDILPYIHQNYKALKFNKPEEFLEEKNQDCNGLGYIFYGGNSIPTKLTKEGETEKTTEDLAKDTMLGVLRMDVDSLGSIFRCGLPSHQRTFGSLATMSFLLNMFFTKYIAEHREKKDKDKNYRDWVNILYAGGDDLFIYGRWWEVLEFAQVIKQQFRQFTGNDDLTISAGLVFVHGKFPISKAAYLAQEAEDQAKENEKNAITFFGHRVSWKEFESVKRLKTDLVNYIENKRLSQGFLQKMMDFYNMQRSGNNSYLWTSLYYLARTIDKKEKDKELKNYLEDLMKNLVQTPSLYEKLAIASRWAEKELKLKKI